MAPRPATIPTITRWDRLPPSAPPANGLVWASNAFTVTAGTPYGQFVASYGFPALAPGKWSAPFGVTSTGTPFVVCTTCHNQHVMTVYTSSKNSPIAGDGGGNFYATYFFINGPYNPNYFNIHGHAGSFNHPVLPPVPLWRIERGQQHQQRHHAIPVERLFQGEREILSPLFS